MKKVMMGLVFVFLSLGCGSVDAVHDDTEQSFTVTNSADSTFRIVDGQANKVGELLKALEIDGNGIHKGGSQSFAVSSDDCDENWRVVVYYNDPEHKDCALIKTIPCGGSANFVFNNTTCNSGL